MAMEHTQETWNEFIRRYTAGEAKYRLTEEMNLDHRDAVIRLRAAGVLRSTSRFKHWDEFAERYVAGESMTDLSKEYGVDRSNAHTQMRHRGVARKTLGPPAIPCNESAFDVPSPDRDYWAGFLIADGGVSDSKGTPVVKLSLQPGDVSHLYKLKKFLETDKQVYLYKYPALSVRSQKLVDSLALLGVVPRKSLREQAGASVAMSPHFWRGVVDGDGSIDIWDRGKYGRPYNRLDLVGSETLCTQFREYVVTVTNTRAQVHMSDKRTPLLARFQLVGSPATDVVRALYGSCPATYLDRKYEKALQMLEAPPTRRYVLGGGLL